MKSAPAIGFEYRPSRLVALGIAVVIALAISSIGLSGLDWEIRSTLAVVVAIYGGIALRRFVASSSCRCLWHEAGHWRIAETNGSEHVAELIRSVVRGNFIVLTLRGRQRKSIVILAPDNADADLRRRLRVRLARASAVPSQN